MLTDFKYIFLWWLVVFVFGASILPFTVNLFRRFFNKGYIFSKIIAIAFVSYCLFVLGVFKLVPFTAPSAFIFLLLLIFVNYYCFLFKKKKLNNFGRLIKNNYRVFLMEESMFLAILIFWSFIRGYNPTIEGLEKFMDWGFVNSILRSRFMPPADMWFAGKPINYYFFGHLIFALLTKVSGISSAITYNLAIATVCALTFVSGFSLTANFIHQFGSKKINYSFVIIGGLISALFLTFGGNLHPLYKIARLNIKQNNGQLILSSRAIKQAVANYWYPDATRFIGFDPETNDKTIHEFPIYSFVVADLHGHMNDIPIVLLFIALLLALIPQRVKLYHWSLMIGGGLVLAWAYMTNAWDFAIYGLLFALIYFLVHLDLKKLIINGVGIILFWYLFTLPFSLHFTPMIQGLRLADSQTPLYQLFVLYGGFWLIILPFIIALFIDQMKRKEKSFAYADLFVLGLIVTATILIAIPEIVYLKDIYIFAHRRANTMFKLVYQAFIMYSLTTGYVIVRLTVLMKNRFVYLIYKILFLLIFICHLSYPYFAIRSYYGLKKYRGLDGMDFIRNQFPDNYEAINWISTHISGQPVMLEAAGDSYTTYNQISVATGLPTVEGWLVHEWLWRGGYDLPGTRAAEVEKIYTASDKSEVRRLLQKYRVSYIFVGSNEIQKYPTLNETNFLDLGYQIVFESGQAKIYQVNN
ncbi:MAG TPA: DUF2298 domain-containing protein [Candidatus Woesebacteria bacterium]|nr:DUF2298 domain-containing protein [Candidatus Woesebacteria bacterium]